MSRSQRHKKALQGVTSSEPINNQPVFKTFPRIGTGQTAPTNIVLTPATITAASALGTVVGTLTNVDAQSGLPGETVPTDFVYEMTGTDGDKWELGPTNDQVRKKAAVTAADHTITVKVTDPDGMSFSKALTITVT